VPNGGKQDAQAPKSLHAVANDLNSKKTWGVEQLESGFRLNQ
jgi:hypothetical protein